MKSSAYATALIAALALLLGALCAHAQPRPLQLGLAQDIHRLAPHTEYLHDPSGKLDLAAIRARAAQAEFAPMPAVRENFGYADGAYWFHFTLQNLEPERRDWLLVIEYALLDRVTLFRIDADGRISERQTGDRTRFDTRDADLRNLNLALDLPAGGASEFYLRVVSQSSMQVPLVVARKDAYFEALLPGAIGLGVYYGIQLALMLYNLILWISVRDRNFLWYVLYAGGMCLVLLCLNGLAFQYLWPNLPDWGNLAVLLSIAMVDLCMLQFARSFLELPRHAPRVDRVARIVMAIAAAMIPAALLAPYRIVIQFQTVLAILIALLVLMCALSCVRRYAPARHFLLAWALLLLGMVIYSAVSLGLLPKVPLTEYSLQIGSGAEMILLSFALAYRINLLKAENERIQSEAREQLEARVRARTAELDATLHRLEDANRRLQDFSRRDGLTAVYNRRHFDELVVQMCVQARERVRPLALLMVDVDHFKEINDRHGHLVGDDCLRAIAQILDRRVREADGVLARYGGEEFAILLPDTDLEPARQLAETLRAEIAASPIRCEQTTIALTVSIGLYGVPPGYPCSAAELLRHADAALYIAKRGGRNRIEVSALV